MVTDPPFGIELDSEWRDYEEAAKTCDTPVRTLFRRLKDRAFDLAYPAVKSPLSVRGLCGSCT